MTPIAKPLALLLLLCLLLPCVASAALVEYPQEYYTLTNQSNVWYLSEYVNYNDDFFNDNSRANIATIGSFIELRLHTILLERQNELLAEQNELLRNMSARCG